MTVRALFKCLEGTGYYTKNLGMFYSDVRIVGRINVVLDKFI